MITNYTQLTGKYLKANRRRTVLTIIGIILSVALISSIGFFLKGMQESQIRDVKNSSGSFHLVFTKNVNADLVAKVSGNPKVKRSGLYATGKNYTVSKRIVLTETITSDQALELLPYRIKEGHFPEAPDEVAIEKWALRYIDQQAKPGDVIYLENQKFILAGVLEDQVRNQIKSQGILLTRSNNIDLKNASLLVEVSSKTNIRKALHELELLSDKSSYVENTNLLRVLGLSDKRGFKGEYLVFGVIIGIVVISTIAVIYNSFQISVVERVKQFGLLRTIGTTPRQIRKIVFKEATVLAVIAIPLGLLLGIFAIYVISYVFAFLVDGSIIIARTALSLKVILISIGLGLFSIYASALIPAIFAGRISPLVAISSRALIAKEKIKRRKSWLIGKIFGFEGELASKNIKRNPKRYRITVFSIVISVVLFVTFTSFMSMVFNVTQTYNETTKLHFAIYGNLTDNNRAINDEIIEQVRAIPVVSKVYKQYTPLFAGTVIDSARELPELQKMKTIYQHVTWQGDSKTFLFGTVDIYDRDSLEAAKNYVTAGSINPEKMNQENGVIIIDRNMIANKATRRTFFGPIADLKVGDEINLELNSPRQQDQIKPGQGMKIVTGGQSIEFGKGEVKKVKVLAIVKDDPFSFLGAQNSLKMITTEEVGKRLSGQQTLHPTTLNIVLNDAKNEEIAKAELDKVVQADPALNVVNFIDSNRMEKSSILMLQILLYGFVVVVTCIGCVNIINTITTNMILRKREFAMLKSIGITQKGLRKMITLEGMLYGVVGTIYGSILACGFSYLLYIGLMDIRESVWRIPWGPIGIAGVAAIAIGYLSVLAPLRKIKRENLIDVVREDY